MFKQILKILLGVVSFPVCIAASLSLYEQLSRIGAISYNQGYFLFGITAYLVVHAVLFKPVYPYILSHELMHVIATWMSGGKVSSFKVSSRGGRVTANKSNIFIALAPYFFPFYTIIATLIFLFLPLVFDIKPPYAVFLFLVGFTFTFHIVLTIDFLKTKQSDFLKAGYLFSICLIYLMNIIIMAFIFSLTFPDVVFLEFIKSIYLKSKDIYVAVFRQLFM